MLHLICPFCHGVLDTDDNFLRCNKCLDRYPVIEGIPCFVRHEEAIIKFYEDWHKEPHKCYNLKGLGQPVKTHPFINKYRFIFEKILYTQFQRERFFKSVSRMLENNKHRLNVLDLGCGGGSEEYLKIGDVYGVDYCFDSMRYGIAREKYKMAVNCNAASLPFGDGQFDCILSSDFIGHIPQDQKDRLFAEMSRVLKYDGICAHIIETSSDNFVSKFARKYPDLYRKYFIEGIGGHFGLELPAAVLNRFRAVGFEPVSVKKYYSYIWDIESFIALFDNEYKEKSFLLKCIVSFYKLLCKVFPVKVVAVFLIGFFSWIVDALTPLNKAEGILIICRKKDAGNVGAR